MNISSIIVQTLPKNLEQVIRDLKNCGVCEYHVHDEKGRIIVTVEGEDISEEMKKLRVIEAIPNVIAADMHMSYSEDELDEHMEILKTQEAVPKVLNDDSIPVENIVYHGDLKKKVDLEEFAKSLKGN